MTDPALPRSAAELVTLLGAAGFGAPTGLTDVTAADRAAFTEQLGRPPRGMLAVAHHCAHGVPASVLTAPRLPDGTPFPTLYYLSCKVLNTAVSRMEAAGVMRAMTEELSQDDDLARRYRLAHNSYLATRNLLDDLGIAVTAGGMPDRVKCLHVLVAHALAAGPGVNPLGDKAIGLLTEYFRGERPCVGSADATS